MFDIALFAVLVGVSLPGLVVTVPRQMRSMRALIESSSGPAARMPSTAVLSLAGILQNLVLVALAAAAGVALAPEAGLAAPFFAAVAAGHLSADVVVRPFLTAVGIGAVAAIPFLLGYYGLARPRLDAVSVRATEGLRMDLGIAGRILYGGIVEEILARWGLMTALVWVGARLAGPSLGVIWAAILVAGLLFGLGHLPAARAVGARMTGPLVVSSILLNLYASVVFGWLFWQHGLMAAMVGHIVFHLVWLPFERRAYRRDWPAT